MTDRIERMRKRLGLAESDPLGMFGTYGEGTEITESPDGGMTLKMVITTDAVDLDGDIVNPDGADWSYWEKLGYPFYVDHEYEIDNIAGRGRPKSLKLVKLGGMSGWTISVGVRKTEEGMAIASIVRDFGQIGASIGFKALEYRQPNAEESKRFGVSGIKASRVITKWLGLETSFTMMPCNPTAGGKAEKMLNELDRMVTKGAITLKAAHALGLPEKVKAETRTDAPKRRIIWCGK